MNPQHSLTLKDLVIHMRQLGNEICSRGTTPTSGHSCVASLVNACCVPFVNAFENLVASDVEHSLVQYDGAHFIAKTVRQLQIPGLLPSFAEWGRFVIGSN